MMNMFFLEQILTLKGMSIPIKSESNHFTVPRQKFIFNP